MFFTVWDHPLHFKKKTKTKQNKVKQKQASTCKYTFPQWSGPFEITKYITFKESF